MTPKDTLSPADLTVDQLAGQRLMVGFDGTSLNNDLKYLIDKLKIGGIVLFARNISHPSQVLDLCQSAQQFAAKAGQPPLFIAIDQEGGQVARLKKPFTEFPGNPFITNEKDAIRFASITASELKSVGINMNLAPVLDINCEDVHSIMAERSFGSDPVVVARMGDIVIRHFQKNGIPAVAKHFPGIGRTTLDSHLAQPTLSITMADLEASELVPFRSAIEAGVSGIMLSHIRYDKLDAEWPASLSTRIARDLLRDQMEYSGIVLTDDLDMGSIKGKYSMDGIMSRILAADIDQALICHKGPDIEAAFKALKKRLSQLANLRQKGIESVTRIIELKERMFAQ